MSSIELWVLSAFSVHGTCLRIFQKRLDSASEPALKMSSGFRARQTDSIIAASSATCVSWEPSLSSSIAAPARS